MKKHKSSDHEGYVNEIFMPGIIGDNLKSSILTMFNKIKENQVIPEFMKMAEVTTIPKSGSKIEPKNERGVFRVSILRGILMRIIYNRKYPLIEENMSDCQIGARKGKRCSNNIFITNGLIHEANSSIHQKPITMQIYDYSQMYDSMHLKSAVCDLFEYGIQDDTLSLLYHANKTVKMAVKTPYGLTVWQTLKNVVLQGDTWGPSMASVQVDSIGQKCMEAGNYYLYKKQLPIGILGMCDDMIGVTEAGYKAHKLFINSQSVTPR